MMKQPAENTNATADEIKQAEERRHPPMRNTLEDQERFEELARRLTSDNGESQELAKARAKEVLHNLKNAEAKP